MFQLVFMSNYLNHHQIPFCDAMRELLQDNFVFIQTEPMEEERLQMGWQEVENCPYLRFWYEEPDKCKELVARADVVVFGGTDDESFIEERLLSGKPVVRYSERLYRTGQWKAISPRGLKKKYHDHTRYRNAKVYLLCSGAYVPSDFQIVRAYPGKKFCWGYFTETKHYDVDKLLAGKGYGRGEQKIPYLLWAARFIPLKHPELPLQTAKYLKERGLRFHLDMVGGGCMEEEIRWLIQEYDLGDCVSLLGYLTPDEVRACMEKADIFLFTSDRNEGWGAVANESMNSGCALVANHMIGSVPYLVKQGYNGSIYRDGDAKMLFENVEKLVRDSGLCKEMGRNAYETIAQVWNAENAAKELVALIENVVFPGGSTQKVPGSLENLHPCAPAPVISERSMWTKLSQKD